MYVAKFPTALCSLYKTLTRDILKFRQATWDTPLAGPQLYLLKFMKVSFLVFLQNPRIKMNVTESCDKNKTPIQINTLSSSLQNSVHYGKLHVCNGP